MKFGTCLTGAAVNQDGRSSSFTAPNGPSQQAVITQALAEAELLTTDVAALQMHGTGTALGDPIELGAALPLFSGDLDASCKPRLSSVGDQLNADGPPPITLLAVKSMLGHSEPASGVTGAIYATHQLHQMLAAPLLHLRTLNPHITSGISTSSSSPVAVSIPRECVPLSLGQEKAVGVSAFAFQGTNAHVVLQKVQGLDARHGSSVRNTGNIVWDHASLWVHPEPMPLISYVVLSSTPEQLPAVFECHISTTRLGYLWDHQVLGRALVPGTFFLELGTQCAKMLLGVASDVTKQSNWVPALVGASIPTPCVLPSVSSKDAAVPVVLQCRVAGESISVRTSEGVTQNRVHMNAAVSYIAKSGDHTAFSSQPTKGLCSDHASALISVLQTIKQVSTAWTTQSINKSAMADIHMTDQRAGCHTVCPAEVDAALQLSAVSRGHVYPHLSDVLQVPVAAECYVSAHHSHSGSHMSAISSLHPEASSSSISFDSRLLSSDVDCVCHIINLTAKAVASLGAKTSEAAAAIIYEVTAMRLLPGAILGRLYSLACQFTPTRCC